MARIKNLNKYNLKNTPNREDYLIGTDSENGGKTVNFLMDDIMTLISSNMGELSQDNKFKEINFGFVSSSDDTNISIATKINSMLAFTIEPDEIPIFRGYVSGGRNVGSSYNTYVVKGYGRGTYGLNALDGIILQDSDLLLIDSVKTGGVVFFPPLDNDPNAEVITLGEIPDGNFLPILNTQPAFEVVSGTNLYIEFTINGARNLYGFSGDNGTYGSGNTQVIDTDVFLIYSETDNPEGISGIDLYDTQGNIEEEAEEIYLAKPFELTTVGGNSPTIDLLEGGVDLIKLATGVEGQAVIHKDGENIWGEVPNRYDGNFIPSTGGIFQEDFTTKALRDSILAYSYPDGNVNEVTNNGAIFIEYDNTDFGSGLLEVIDYIHTRGLILKPNPISFYVRLSQGDFAPISVLGNPENKRIRLTTTSSTQFSTNRIYIGETTDEYSFDNNGFLSLERIIKQGGINAKDIPITLGFSTTIQGTVKFDSNPPSPPSPSSPSSQSK